ncbi:ABC transporter ATP-binding protein [Eilatimonas milleporae]|uniref:ABC-2 type transport system ATP-binding protein n=1 Tax=Eilatimonas milleporae TaxID=911205 RepID=A0A3M0BVA1_9PROT|nr:ABC transporter ATP-binding protein [Eilatimonas milleporae]RMB01504.1 ABC-2 type transport system ATP-binding protein [Eilatimonas milleporae]
MTALVEARNLVKRFGPFTAVDGISLTVAKGEVLGFLGPNGAGKTTTMKMLTGYLTPSAGEARIAGIPVNGGAVAARRRVGYLPEGAPLYGDMTVRAFLRFIASAHGMDRDAAVNVVESAGGAVHLDGVMEQRIETLSKGYKRRVGLAAAILHAPEVLILDEPTDGLDPNQKHDVRSLINTMAAERAIIISTHILEEVEALCTRAVIIDRGRLVADGTPSELKARSRYRNAVTMLVPAGETAAVEEALRAVPGVSAVEQAREGAQTRLTVLSVDQADVSSAVAAMTAEKGWSVGEFSVEGGRLDDVFRFLTAGGAS